MTNDFKITLNLVIIDEMKPSKIIFKNPTLAKIPEMKINYSFLIFRTLILISKKENSSKIL